MMISRSKEIFQEDLEFTRYVDWESEDERKLTPEISVNHVKNIRQSVLLLLYFFVLYFFNR